MINQANDLTLNITSGRARLAEIWGRLRQSSLFINLTSVSGANLVSKLINLVTLGYAARVLGPEKFGLVGYGLSIAAYASILLSPGLLTWGTRAIAQDRTHAGRTLVIINLTEFCLVIIGYSVLIGFTHFFISDPDQKKIILVCGLSLIPYALTTEWVFNGLELMRIPAYFGVLNTVFFVAALFTLIHSPKDVFIFPLIGTVINLIIYSLEFLVLRRRTEVQLTWPALSQFREAIIASLPLGVMVALITILHFANNLIVQAYLGTAALGIFLAAYRLLELTSTIPQILGTVFLPRLSRIVADDTTRARTEARLFALVNMMMGFLLGSFMLAEAPAIIGIIYGAKYAGAVILLRLMGVAVIFNFAICGYTSCLISFGQDRVMVMVVVVSAIVAVGGGLLLVPKLGVLGAGLVVAAIDLAGWLMSLPFYRRKIGSLQFQAWVLPLLGGAAIITSSFILRRAGVPVWGRAPVSALAYFPFAALAMRSVLK